MKKVLILMSLLLVVACGKKNEEEQVIKEETVIEQNIEMEEVSEEKNIEEEKVEDFTNLEAEELMVEEEEIVEMNTIMNENLKRYELTNEIIDREPQGQVREYDINTKAFMYNEWVNIGEEKAVVHRWYHLGKDDVPELMATVNLNIKGNRWRTWSSKELNRQGVWVVEVEDYNGNIIIKEELLVR